MNCVDFGFIIVAEMQRFLQLREKWSCDKCTSERTRVLQEELQNVLLQIEELKSRNGP